MAHGENFDRLVTNGGILVVARENDGRKEIRRHGFHILRAGFLEECLNAIKRCTL